MLFKIKHRSKVGKYIRNHVEEFVSLFTMIHNFQAVGPNEIQDELEKIDLENHKVPADKITEILEELSDEDIVDTINECTNYNNEVSITIIQVPMKKMIIL